MIDIKVWKYRTLVGLGAWFWATSAASGVNVTITPQTSIVAQGGTVNFTVTVDPGDNVDQIVVTYQGETDQDIGYNTPFYTSHEFNAPGDNRTVTATVSFTNGDPDEQAMTSVDVVGLILSGPDAPQRGWPTAYVVQPNPSGKTLSDIQWTYAWNGGSNTYQNSTFWPGKMVIDGTMTVSAKVSGVTVQTSMVITITPRSWPISIACTQDNDPNYGNIPTPDAALGENRDESTGYSAYIFTPRVGMSGFTPARTIAEVISGPCDGWWYVASCTLKCQRETVINRYIKQNGPELDGQNFYEVNTDCLVPSVDAFIQAVKNHEYRGTPDTPKSFEGHQGAIELSILDEGHDAKQDIEDLVRRDPDALSSVIDSTISAHEWAVLNTAMNEMYLQGWGPNWGGGTGSLGAGEHSRWDADTESWTICNNGPISF